MVGQGNQNNGDVQTVAFNHERFLKHLDDSIEAMWICAKYLYNWGYPVKINPMTKSKTHGEWRTHIDKGDLEIVVEGVPQRIEVKGLSASFTRKEDWKFPDFIICAAHSWDIADPKPLAYMLLNKERTHAAIVYGRDSATWIKAKKRDHRYTDYQQEFYFSPLEQVVWKSLA